MTIQILRETHKCPPNIEAQLVRSAGVNQFGEPLIRAVWGWNRLTTICGKWTLTDSHGNFTGEHEEWGRVPLYTPPHFNPNRWYFERWKSAEEFFGNPDEWEESNEGNPTMPFDSRGEYDHIFTLQSPDGEFVQLTATIAAEVVRRYQLKRNESRGEKVAIGADYASKQDKDYDSFADSVLNDTNKFQGYAHIYIP